MPVLVGRALQTLYLGQDGLVWASAGGRVIAAGELAGAEAEVAGSAGAGLRPPSTLGGRTLTQIFSRR